MTNRPCSSNRGSKNLTPKCCFKDPDLGRECVSNNCSRTATIFVDIMLASLCVHVTCNPHKKRLSITGISSCRKHLFRNHWAILHATAPQLTKAVNHRSVFFYLSLSQPFPRLFPPFSFSKYARVNGGRNVRMYMTRQVGRQATGTRIPGGTNEMLRQAMAGEEKS